jgi:hypothetical protein
MANIADIIKDRTGFSLLGQPQTYGRERDILAVIVERDGFLLPVAVSYQAEAARSANPCFGEAIAREINEVMLAGACRAHIIESARKSA